MLASEMDAYCENIPHFAANLFVTFSTMNFTFSLLGVFDQQKSNYHSFNDLKL